MKKQRRIAKLLWAAVTLLGANAATAQPATKSAIVTFYSHGNRWTSGLPGSNHGIFYGKVFSGENALVSFYVPFALKNNQVISFHFPPGDYAFSASYGKHASKKRISLALNPKRDISCELSLNRGESSRLSSRAVGWTRFPVKSQVKRRRTQNQWQERR